MRCRGCCSMAPPPPPLPGLWTHSPALSWSAARPGSQGAEVGCPSANLRQGHKSTTPRRLGVGGDTAAHPLACEPLLRGTDAPLPLTCWCWEPTHLRLSTRTLPEVPGPPRQQSALMGGELLRSPSLHHRPPNSTPPTAWPLAHRKPGRPTLLGKGLSIFGKVSPGGFTLWPGENCEASPAVLP